MLYNLAELRARMSNVTRLIAAGKPHLEFVPCF